MRLLEENEAEKKREIAANTREGKRKGRMRKSRRPKQECWRPQKGLWRKKSWKKWFWSRKKARVVKARHIQSVLCVFHCDDVAERNGQSWIACSCGRWLHEDCSLIAPKAIPTLEEFCPDSFCPECVISDPLWEKEPYRAKFNFTFMTSLNAYFTELDIMKGYFLPTC